MVIIEDTRQQATKHAIKHGYFTAAGIGLIRCKLPFGDYALPPAVSVDTKADMAEIAGNIGGAAEHRRFRAECQAAQEAGCQLVILVENDDGIECLDDVRHWVNPRLSQSPHAITGERLMKAMRTMTERYGVRFEFCAPHEAGRRVMEILEAEYGQDERVRTREGTDRGDSADV